MSAAPGGYEVIRYEDRRVQIVEQWRGKYGPNANTASDTVDGLLIDIITRLAQFCDERGFAAYSAHFFMSAIGLELDMLLAPFFGTKRRPDRGSVAEAVFYGETGTVVVTGALVSTSDTAKVFEMQDAAVTIDASSIVVVVFGPVTELNSTGITINGDVYPSSPVAPIIGSGQQVAQHFIDNVVPNFDDNIASVYPTAGVDPIGNGVVVIELKGPWSALATSSHGTAETWRGVRAGVTCQEVGKIEANALSLNRINTPLSGLKGVINIVDATLGGLEDTDPEYRAQHLKRFGQAATATPMGLRARTYKIGATWARVDMNATHFVDFEGRPPNSFELVVDGGLTDKILEQIWVGHTTGTQSWGSEVHILVDSRDGVERQIRFTRATHRYVWLDIVIFRGEGFPAAAIADIQKDVAARIFAFADAEIGPGDDVYIDELKGHIGLRGTSFISISMATTTISTDPKPTLFATDLIIGSREISKWDLSRIKVTVV